MVGISSKFHGGGGLGQAHSGFRASHGSSPAGTFRRQLRTTLYMHTNVEKAMATKPMAKSMGVASLSEPPHMVPIQLKIFTPVGTAMNMVDIEKADTATGPSPTANMWWTHTPQPMNPMAMPEKTMTGYPNSGF